MVLLSQCWEMLFLVIFDLPKFGKRCFHCFSVFPTLGNVIFSNFWFSQCWETQFLAFSWFPNIGKTVFISCHRGLILDERADDTGMGGRYATKTTASAAKINLVIPYNWRCIF